MKFKLEDLQNSAYFRYTWWDSFENIISNSISINLWGEIKFNMGYYLRDNLKINLEYIIHNELRELE